MRIQNKSIPARWPKSLFITRQGFTLVEVLVGVMIMSVVIAMASSLLIRSAQASKQARDITTAALLARSELDRQINLPFEKIVAGRRGAFKEGSTEFLWDSSVKTINENLARIDLVVMWSSNYGNMKQEFSCVRRRSP
jgi:prepilin-type N-terminal cleavage/methylation domain-containing protein